MVLSFCDIVFSLISARVKPLSTRLPEIEKKTASKATKPKSAGVSSLAKTILTTKIESRVPSLEVKVQIKPENVRWPKDNVLRKLFD